jgi:hypothetical protein
MICLGTGLSLWGHSSEFYTITTAAKGLMVFFLSAQRKLMTTPIQRQSVLLMGKLESNLPRFSMYLEGLLCLPSQWYSTKSMTSKILTHD